jgi:hypothetical protein
MSARVLSSLALGTLIVAIAAGCGSSAGKPVSVEGLVTLDGEPVDGATVLFSPEDGKGPPASGMTGTDGVFHLTTFNTGDGAMPGKYNVTITKLAGGGGSGGPQDIAGMSAADKAAAMARMMSGTMDKEGKSNVKFKAGLPEVYGTAKSQLKATVPADGQIKFALRSTGGT